MKYKLINNVDPMLTTREQIAVNRGLTVGIEEYVNTTDDVILSLDLIDNITEGAILLLKTIKNKKHMFVQIDSDVDGYTSSAYLMNYLHKLFPTYVEHYISYRVHDGKEHGVYMPSVPPNVSLVVLPDSSSNQYEEHQELKERGIDVLVIDHHEADKVSENAVVINNQLCDYPNKSLSGVGMVYKVCCKIDELLQVKYADDGLDIVALGLVADMMSLAELETKHLVHKGIKNITNPFFVGMVEKNAFSLGDTVTPFGISFYIAPFINAVVRMGTEEEKMIVFDSMLDYKGYNQIPSTKRGCAGKTEYVAAQGTRNAINCKSRQKKEVDKGVALIEGIIHENNLLSNKILLVKLPENACKKTLTGLIANILMSKYCRPVLLLHKTLVDDEVVWQGSGRGYDRSDFGFFKDFLNESDLTEYAEGHQSAFGASITEDKMQNFIDYSNIELEKYTFSAEYLVDFVYDKKDLTKQDIIDNASLRPFFGKQFEESFIVVKNITIPKERIFLNGKGLKTVLKLLTTDNIELIKFKATQEEFDEFTEKNFITISVIASCSINTWGGKQSPQLTIEDYEIVSKFDHCF